MYLSLVSSTALDIIGSVDCRVSAIVIYAKFSNTY